MEKINK